MLREKKGVTLGILVVAIILMFIIFGVTMSAGTDLLRNSDKNRLMTNLYLIRARASTLLEDYLFDRSAESLTDLGESADSAQIEAVGFTEDESCEYIYCIWNTSKLTEQGIDTENVSAAESFIVQYNITNDRVDVASTKGFENEDGDIIYILSDLEENQ